MPTSPRGCSGQAWPGWPWSTRTASKSRIVPPHHRDPFDRLLVAQAQVERLTIVTADPLFDA